MSLARDREGASASFNDGLGKPVFRLHFRLVKCGSWL